MCGGGGGEYLRPFPPHGSEGISVVGNGGESLSPSGQIRGENLREDFQSPRTSPHVHWGLGQKWARIVSEAARWAEGPESTTELVQRSAGEGAARPGGWGEGRSLGESEGRERGGHPLFPPILLSGRERWLRLG